MTMLQGPSLSFDCYDQGLIERRGATPPGLPFIREGVDRSSQPSGFSLCSIYLRKLMAGFQQVPSRAYFLSPGDIVWALEGCHEK